MIWQLPTRNSFIKQNKKNLSYPGKLYSHIEKGLFQRQILHCKRLSQLLASDSLKSIVENVFSLLSASGKTANHCCKAYNKSFTPMTWCDVSTMDFWYPRKSNVACLVCSIQSLWWTENLWREVQVKEMEEVSLKRVGQNEERCGVGKRILLYQDLSNWHLNGLIKCEIGFMLCYLLGDMLSL